MLWWILLGLLAAGLLVAAYAILIERRWYRLARYRLDILPGGGSLTILHLSDLHMIDGEAHKRRFLESLPRADVTIVTGDLLGEPEAVEYVVESLRPLRGRLASLFVLGSNDIYVPRPMNPLRYFVPHEKRRRRRGRRGRAPDLVNQLEADGWVHLRNLRRDGSLDGVPMEILGLDDPHIHRGNVSLSPRRQADRFGLAVVHSPDPAPELAALGWDLIVTGHTHGGQVRLPWGRAIVTNSSIPRRMASGLHRIGGSFLHVSPGLGTSKYAPFRLFCRPEATVLDLRSGG
ncbi:MAG TPA: metallophosphoesterase [Actinomycetota bacterium]